MKKLKLKNEQLNNIYIENINKKEDYNNFENEIRVYIKNKNLNKDDCVDIIILLSRTKIKKRRFIYFILKHAMYFNYFFINAKANNENFLINTFLKILEEYKLIIIKWILKKEPLYIYHNFEHIKRIYTSLNIYHLYESKLKKEYYHLYMKDYNKKHIDFSDFIDKKSVDDFIKSEKLEENKLKENFLFMDKMLETIPKNINFDIFTLLKNKFNLEDKDIKDIDNKGINLYNKTSIEQTISLEDYNRYTEINIQLIQISKIRNSIFNKYRRILENEHYNEILYIHIINTLKKKYNFVAKQQHIQIIIESIKYFLYGENRAIFAVIPILEKIIKENLELSVLDVLHNNIFLNEWDFFKNIYVKQSNIKDIISKNNEIQMKGYFSLDIRNKFCHGLFIDYNDESNSAIYTYMFCDKIFELKSFYLNS